MKKKLIIDLGAHKGEDSDFYLRKGFKVVAVEASETLYQLIVQRFRDHTNNNDFIALNYAISNKDNEFIEFYENIDNSAWSTIFNSWNSRNKKFGTGSEKKSVKSLRLDTLIKQELQEDDELEFIKIDIEGADTIALRSLLNSEIKPKFISLESDKLSWKNLLEEFDILEQLGYHKFKIIDQSKIHEQVCPHPSREGDYINYQFENGSTGLFGDDLPGKWLSAEEAKKTYKKIFIRYRYFGDYGIFNNKLIMKNRVLNKFMQVCKLKYPHVGWYDTHASI